MSLDPVRSIQRGNRKILVIEFPYYDTRGRLRRFRRDARAQTLRAARAEAKRLQELAATTGSPYPEATTPTFGDFYDDSYRSLVFPRLRPATRDRYDRLMRQGVRSSFGSVLLDEIDAPMMRTYEAMLITERGISPRGHINFIRSVIRAAVELEVLPDMPKLPSAPGPTKKLPRAPRSEDVVVTLSKANGWAKLAIALAYFAGLRTGEIRALQVHDIDFEEELIFVRRAFSEDELEDSPKDKEERVIPLLPALRGLLEEAVKGKRPGHFLVQTRTGSTPGRRAVWLANRAAQKRAGVKRAFSVHGLRHGFCSELVRRGASVEEVRRLAGHEDLRTTQRYVHAQFDDLRNAMRRLL